MTSYDRLHIDLSVPPTYYDDDQLAIGSERAFLELQDSAYIRDLGARALIAAQHLLNIAYEARSVLQDWDELPASRRKKIDLLSAVPDLVEGEG
ncbi:hypothetical protein [Dietzia natronolimnaea]|uniref:hypothetical protein n=1 Tax=Dietzia natronolimnaea TaxID=161920 RepID=UPI0015F8F51E|nr:hypothetical protein [Dietzia natronolimnaea]MBB1037356.1 hypothetical protein [Dietzia natronolimnaea]